MSKDEEDVVVVAAMTPPPSLMPMDRAELPVPETEEDLSLRAPLIDSMEREHPMLKAHLGDEKNPVYTIMYSQSQHSDVSFTRPVTPLQVTVPEGTGSPTVPVSCGNATGLMHLQMFLCPGIHQPCIQSGNDLLSPKQFTVRGDKEKQKDWKASIRVGKSSLRTHMEASTIDFYDHANRCSGKCQSRNYVNAPIEREEVIQSRKQKRNQDADYLKNEIETEINGKEPEEKKSTASRKARGRPRGSVNKPRPIVKTEIQHEEFFEEYFMDEQPPPIDDGASDGPVHAPASPERNQTGCSSYADIMSCLQNDPQNFWSQMQQTGVIAHFLDDLIVTAINMKRSVMDQPVSQSLASMLSRTTFALNVQNVIIHRVQSIERSVLQHRRHEEMFEEIQTKVAQEQRMAAENSKPDDEIQIIESSNEIRSFEEIQTAREILEADDFIDVGKYEEYGQSPMQYMPQTQPGPSNAP